MFESTFTLTNTGEEPIDILFEPYGMPFRVPPGATFEVVARGEIEGEIEVERRAEGLILFGWPTSTAKVIIDGVLILDYDMPVPGVPEGASVRSFLGLLFDRDR